MDRRGDVALFATLPVLPFMASSLLGSGGEWTAVLTVLSIAFGTTALTALACYTLAHLTRPRPALAAARGGESPPVSHPRVVVPNPVLEVLK